MIWLALASAALAVIVSGSQFVYAVTYDDKYCSSTPGTPESHACWCEGKPPGHLFQCDHIITGTQFTIVFGCFDFTGVTCTRTFDIDCGDKYYCQFGCSGSCVNQNISCNTFYDDCD